MIRKLKQALFPSVPQNFNQFSPTKLGFSYMVSCCPTSALGSRNMPLIARVSSASFPWRCAPLVAKPTFVVRAESNSEGGGEATENVEDAASDNVEEAPEAEAEEQASEPRPPRKPRVKLGDIMGVNFLHLISCSCHVFTATSIKE